MVRGTGQRATTVVVAVQVSRTGVGTGSGRNEEPWSRRMSVICRSLVPTGTVLVSQVMSVLAWFGEAVVAIAPTRVPVVRFQTWTSHVPPSVFVVAVSILLILLI